MIIHLYLKIQFFTVKGVIHDIHGMWPIMLGYFFPNNYDGNKDILFEDHHGPRG